MRRLYLALILLFAYSGHGYASCKRSGNEGAITITPPSQLVVDSHAYTAGEVLWQSGWVSTSEVTMDGCSRDYKVGFLYEPGSAQSNTSATINANDGNNTPVFSTGISGVGIAIKTQTNAGPYDNVMPIDNTYHNGDGNKTHHAMAPAYNVELVALGGPITSGTATFQSPLARVSFRDSATEDSGGDILTHLYLGNTQLIMKAMGCRVETPAITVDLGSVNLGSFANSQTAGTGEQDILLTCEQGTAISASLSAQPASGNNPDNSVIQLSNASAPTSATGVGVQLGIQAPDAGFFTDSLPINQKIDLFTHTSTTNADGSQTVSGGTMNMSTTLKISARYYKTAATVTAGQANATATLNLTYN
ncbi:type 1 fimbrial protein [Salmonella enterica subsp. enterica]|uniref:fimbrial major subunit SthE n=1 Tax=Salmonella TaxID=590 RepID=UPI0009B0EC22|nr:MULTISPECIES: fimbrial major subunit SthE [Salmonella]EAN5898282.1 type 1 fimbrial protein [Salmonella enterica]EBP4003133.1 type 1 fimbrial protein [Salmonella enterica subsp. enterica]EAR5917554.1 type 1 fimbrial protein [Salmonella enterica]EAR8230190.1 type 1 fimbrial protein [Salmonella enterica]EAT2139186.1 type 1 fimbrial protein [Salmonella enterica]